VPGVVGFASVPPASSRGQAITENLAGDPKIELEAIPTHRPVPKKSAALAKLQKAVRSKKFDFIKHVMKQFERIREERGAEGGPPGAAGASPGRAAYGTRAAGDPGLEPMSDIDMHALSKRRALGALSASSSSDNYEQPEDFTKGPSRQNTLGSDAIDKREDTSSRSSRSAAARAGRPRGMSSS